MCKGHHYFDCAPSFILYNFLLLSLFSLPPCQMTSLLNNPMKIDDNAMVGILCDDTMSENYANLLQFNTSWWAFLGPWYYFRLCFSLSSCDYDLTVIKKSHTLNCYLILQKFLLKTKTYQLVFGNCGSSIYCQNTKFRKSYLLFVTSVLFNK